MAVVRAGRRVDGWSLATALAAALLPTALLGTLGVLLAAAWPALARGGLAALGRGAGDLGPPTLPAAHGALGAPPWAGVLPLVAGTALTSGLALVLAVPVGVGVAVCLAERGRGGLGRAAGVCVQWSAGVPGVVFGLWALAVLVPWVRGTVGPALVRAGHALPAGLPGAGGLAAFLRGPVGSGQGVLAAALVLAVMVVPLVAATGREALLAVPAEVREQGRALGLTDWETLRDLVWPLAARGVAGGVALALGRALGEAMAVVLVGGAGALVPHTLLDPTTTMASVLVLDLRRAVTDPTGRTVHALAAVALALFSLTLLVHLAVPLLGLRPARPGPPAAGGGEQA